MEKTRYSEAEWASGAPEGNTGIQSQCPEYQQTGVWRKRSGSPGSGESQPLYFSDRKTVSLWSVCGCSVENWPVGRRHRYRQIYSGLPAMWKLAISGRKKRVTAPILSSRRIRRYRVLPLKAAEKHVTLVVWGSQIYRWSRTDIEVDKAFQMWYYLTVHIRGAF